MLDHIFQEFITHSYCALMSENVEFYMEYLSLYYKYSAHAFIFRYNLKQGLILSIFFLLMQGSTQCSIIFKLDKIL